MRVVCLFMCVFGSFFLSFLPSFLPPSLQIVDVVSLLQVLVNESETEVDAGCTFAEIVNGDDDEAVNIVDAVFWLQEILNQA